METRDDWPEWGQLIDDARDRMAISQNEASRRVGITGTRWRDIVKGKAGSMASKRGVYTVARMAYVVGLTAAQFEAVGRRDVAIALKGLASPDLGDDFEARIERIRQNPAARQRLLDLMRAARLPEAEESDERERRSDVG